MIVHKIYHDNIEMLLVTTSLKRLKKFNALGLSLIISSNGKDTFFIYKAKLKTFYVVLTVSVEISLKLILMPRNLFMVKQ